MMSTQSSIMTRTFVFTLVLAGAIGSYHLLSHIRAVARDKEAAQKAAKKAAKKAAREKVARKLGVAVDDIVSVILRFRFKLTCSNNSCSNCKVSLFHTCT